MQLFIGNLMQLLQSSRILNIKGGYVYTVSVFCVHKPGFLMLGHMYTVVLHAEVSPSGLNHSYVSNKQTSYTSCYQTSAILKVDCHMTLPWKPI